MLNGLTCSSVFTCLWFIAPNFSHCFFGRRRGRGGVGPSELFSAHGYREFYAQMSNPPFQEPTFFLTDIPPARRILVNSCTKQGCYFQAAGALPPSITPLIAYNLIGISTRIIPCHVFQVKNYVNWDQSGKNCSVSLSQFSHSCRSRPNTNPDRNLRLCISLTSFTIPPPPPFFYYSTSHVREPLEMLTFQIIATNGGPVWHTPQYFISTITSFAVDSSGEI